MPINLKLDRDLQNRIQRLADTRHQSPDSIVAEAIELYLGREEKSAHDEGADKHPSGRHWPLRSPVGGIITPA